MIKGTIIEIEKDTNNKLPVIKELNKSFGIRYPTKILL
tara:strand:- start:50 stop:163 length:114 start_codon:yes stop_codon:yes gene_type:complete